MDAEEANQPLELLVFCIGNMGKGQTFYAQVNTWFGGDDEVMK
ncbi:hypothetical protein [Halomonas gemina]|nr:hypothetical protein [Halomonas gemina]